MNPFRKKFSLKLGLAFWVAGGLFLGFSDVLIINNLKKHLVQTMQENLETQARQLLPLLPPEALAAKNKTWHDTLLSIEKKS